MEPTDITQIMVGISRLEEKADATNAHLAQLNGSVKTLYGRSDANKDAINAVKMSLLQHQQDCPGLRKIVELGERMTSEDATKNTTDKWKKDVLLPLVRWLLTGIVLLFLFHANDILKALK
jgi:hypothetical protein